MTSNAQLGNDLRDDFNLVTDVLSGQSKAFDEIVRRYQPRILHCVSHYIDDLGEARDLCQEVFLKAFRSLSLFKADSSLYTWLYRIAVNTVKNHYRFHASRVGFIDIDFEYAELAGYSLALIDNSNPESLVLVDELTHRMQQAVDNLPVDIRHCFYLREIDGLSYEDIACCMHCPVGTVRSRIHRARQVMDEAIKKG